MNPASPPDTPTAVQLLRALVTPADGRAPADLPPGPATAWLITHGLGPLAHGRFRQHQPALAAGLAADVYASAAANSVHFDNLARITAELSAAGIPFAVLKGAALAQTAYDGRARRTMDDLDLWIPAAQFQAAVERLLAAGFRMDVKPDRPHALQLLADGEVRLVRPAWPNGLVELHLSPYSGWWLKRTAAVDNAAIWARVQPLPGCDGALQLAPEDMVIHLAVHAAVNHQLGMMALRSCVDIALYSQAVSVNWPLVLRRARAMRVHTAVWLVLAYADRLFALPGLAPALQAARPGRLRLALLQRMLPLDALLHGRNLQASAARYAFLLLLVDRTRDRARLIARTLVPEREWLAARYGREHAGYARGYLRHVRQLLVNRGV